MIIFLGLLTITCSDNSSGNDDNENPQNGNVTFTVSGDSNGEKSGTAVFDVVEGGVTHFVEISMWDNPSTFTLAFAVFSTDPLDVPTPGTYSIGQTDLNGEVFEADYTIAEADDVLDYENYTTSYGEHGGTLTITESSENHIEGTFSLTVGKYDQEQDEYVGEITINDGEFYAIRD